MLPAYGSTQQCKLVSACWRITACRVKLICLGTVTPDLKHPTSALRHTGLVGSQLPKYVELYEDQPAVTSTQVAPERLAGGSELRYIKSNLPVDRDTPNHPDSVNVAVTTSYLRSTLWLSSTWIEDVRVCCPMSAFLLF